MLQKIIKSNLTYPQRFMAVLQESSTAFLLSSFIFVAHPKTTCLEFLTVVAGCCKMKMNRKGEKGKEIGNNLLDSWYFLLLCVSGCIIPNLNLLEGSRNGRFLLLSQKDLKPSLQILSPYKKRSRKRSRLITV